MTQARAKIVSNLNYAKIFVNLPWVQMVWSIKDVTSVIKNINSDPVAKKMWADRLEAVLGVCWMDVVKETGINKELKRIFPLVRSFLADTNFEILSMDDLHIIRDIKAEGDELSVSISFSDSMKTEMIESIERAKRGRDQMRVDHAKKEASKKLVYRIRAYFLPEKGKKRKYAQLDHSNSSEDQDDSTPENKRQRVDRKPTELSQSGIDETGLVQPRPFKHRGQHDVTEHGIKNHEEKLNNSDSAEPGQSDNEASTYSIQSKPLNEFRQVRSVDSFIKRLQNCQNV